MGVSGSGKTTVGLALASALGVSFIDGDDLHPAANKAKMAAGTPLTDSDRQPWLAAVGQVLHGEPGRGPVVACSALKKAYRDALRSFAPDTVFLHLAGGSALIRARMVHREHHFMPAALLDSQLDTLEPLQTDERGCVLDTGQTPAAIVGDAVAWLRASV
ncbi:gluconokinase [Subtercola vilae]|uniref:Gluconokinase n=2 Tax=Microbacteriaceae TaxID=85023 RepID=A0A4T2BKZ5_9MICO|nr:gluconokinase [Subtercola vilae]